jgi:DHA1 family multidrug resistance protein-like MFS transporter
MRPVSAAPDPDFDRAVDRPPPITPVVESDETYPLSRSEVTAREIEPGASDDADGDPHWRLTLYAAWVAQLCSIMGFSFVMPFIPFYLQHDLGVTDSHQIPIWAGILTSASGVAMTAAAPLWGIVADRYGRKIMVQRSMFGGAVILGLMGMAHTPVQLLILRMLQGAVTGTVSASVALVASVTPRRRMGYSLGMMQMAVYTGAAAGPWLGGSMADRFGYRAPFAVTAGLLLGGGLLVLFGARERFKRPAPHEPRAVAGIRSLLSLPGVVTLLGIYFMLNLSGTVVEPIFPLFVQKLMGTTKGAASATGVLLAVGGVVAAVAAATVGRSSDRLGHRRVLVATTASVGLLCFPQALAQSVRQLLAIRVFTGFAAGGMGPAVNALMANLCPRNCLGRVYGLTTAASAVGMSIGPSVGGWLAATLGLRLPFVLMGALMLMLALMVQRRVPAVTAGLDAPVAECEPSGGSAVAE